MKRHRRRMGWIGLAVALAAAVAACRPTGDFGRARPSVVHDDLLPAAGRWIASRERQEPVSGFLLTDTELELRDRAFAFVRAPHVRDWWFDALVEGERTRILPLLDMPPPVDTPSATAFEALWRTMTAPAFDTTRYYAFLRTDPDRSTENRWVRVGEAMTGDAALVPPFCAVAAKVRQIDVERLAALGRIAGLEDAYVDNAYARVEENNRVIAWVWRALAYRVVSYRYAIDRLTVETPSERQWDVNRTYDALAAVRCDAATSWAKAAAAGVPRASRLAKGPDPFDQPVLQK